MINNISYEVKLALFTIFSGIFILILIIFLNVKINNLDRLQNAKIGIEKLHVSMLMLRRYEKDFLFRKDLEYEHKHEEELIHIHTLSSEIIKNLNLNNIESTGIEKFIDFIDLYEKSFHSLVYKFVEIGLDRHLGLYGSLRESVHKVQEEALKLKNKELLYKIYDLRKQEKDFMLRSEMKYISSFNKIMKSLLSDPSVKKNIKENLENYHKDFLLFVETQKEIGLSSNLGLRGEMRNNVHKSEDLIQKVSDELSLQITKKADILALNIFSIILIMFILFGLVIFLISKLSQRKLERLRDALSNANNSLEHRVKVEVELSKAKDRDLLEQTRKSENILNKTLKVFGDNVIASDTDKKGIITYVSVAFCKISGYSQDELIGKSHNIVRHPDIPKEIYKEMWSNLKKEKGWDGEIKNLKKSGGFYWVRTTIYPKYDENNQLIGYSAIRHDITPEKVKEEFLANMSHELRTPLNSIIGFSGILQKKLKVGANKELIEYVEASSKHLLTLINDILDLSKMNSSEFKIEPYEFNAYNEINDFSKRFDGLSKKKLVCTTNISENLKAIFEGDWLRISQIILNLMSNSIKFTDAGGTINFDAEYIDSCIILSISDNGIGMNQEAQDKIFKPFAQADGSTTRKYGGTGLGLSITQKLVEAMDGKIELESQENVGTTFKITIPLKKVSDDIAVDEEVEIIDNEVATLSGHILVVEDNKTNQMLIGMLLEDMGVTCDVANDGLEAVDNYDPQIHKIILMDENMPNMNGLEAMKAIREKHKESCGAIIALTANSMVGDRERFLAEGMDGYLSKPIDEAELYKVLKEFL